MIGQKLGSFEVVEQIGRGGMGIVYRAVDLRLRRSVALKVLPAEALRQPDRRERFLREARAASVLNHPHIVTIYEIGSEGGVDFIAMELVEGRSLEEVIPPGGLPLGEALDYALQMTDAVARAHQAGIVHRDLKPGNVVVTGSEQIKILDFGLAKLLQDPSSVPLQLQETQATLAGDVLGTPAYMSPEQAQGKAVDGRSDLFSLGCLFYELLAGESPFRRASAVESLSAILRDTPAPLRERRAELPPELDRILAKALEKDRELRYQNAADLLADLKKLRRDSGVASGVPAAAASTSAARPRRALAGAGLVALAALAALGLWLWQRRPVEHSPLRFELVSTFPGSHRQASFSPDGSYLAFLSDDPQQRPQVFVKSLAGGDPVQVTRVDPGAHRPRWSPKNDRILYDVPGKGIWAVPPLGGAPQQLLAEGYNVNLSPDGERLVYEVGERIWTADADGRNAQPLVSKGKEVVEKNFPFTESKPAFAADGRSVVYFQDRDTDPERGDLWSVALDGSERRRLTADEAAVADPVWMPDGSAIFFSSARRGGLTLWRLPAAGGEPEPVTTGSGEDTEADVSRDGARLIYTNARNLLRLMWLDPKTGERRQLLERRSSVTHPSFSPDGRHLVVFAREGARDQHLLTLRTDGTDLRPLTQGPGRSNVLPDWSRDGRSIYYYEVYPRPGLRRIPAAGGEPTALVEGWSFFVEHGGQVDPKGERVVYTRLRERAPREPGSAGVAGASAGPSPVTLIRDLASGAERPLEEPLLWPRWSPDGELLAAQRLADSALVLCPAGAGACRRLSHGKEPRWSGDGREIYFVRYEERHRDRADAEGYQGSRDPRLVELWKIRPDGTGEEHVADLSGPHPTHFFYDVSPTGEVAWCEFVAGRQELWLADLDVDAGGRQ